jgi:hypothetical protein
MNQIRFVNGRCDGFLALNVRDEPDGAVMVSIGANVEREQELAREESIELLVRIPGTPTQTLGEIHTAAFKRAALICGAAHNAINAQIASPP